MKKYIFAFAALSIILTACSVTRDEAATGTYSEYGPTKVEVTKAIPVDAMLADFVKNGSKRNSYTVTAGIEEVCAKAGCWINIKSKTNAEMMVRFKDHFTIPVDTKIGTQAFLHGDLYTDTVSVDWLRHYAEDAGKSQAEIDKITEPKITMGFEADGIKFLAKK